MENIPSSILGGGISGVVIIGLVVIYKLCVHRSFRCRSGCCSATISSGQEQTPPIDAKDSFNKAESSEKPTVTVAP